jgi:cyclomaltodextrinase
VSAASEPGWVEYAIWWQIYPLGFTGADTTGGDHTSAHRLPQLLSWLDYAVALGASGLALGPIFASTGHGYDTVDHYRIDPRLGTEDDFAHLVDAAHARGLRILLDGVFNHVGQNFPAFQEVLAEGPRAARADWFRISWPDAGGAPDYATFEGHEQLVTLNHDNPAVADYVSDVMQHWLARGADGWRLDAAYAVPEAFWADVLGRVRRSRPDAYLVGEVIHGDYPAIVAETGMHAVTQYELWKAIWSSLNDRNFFELAWSLGRHNEYLEDFVPLTFVGNHDVTRIASRLVDHRHLPHALVVLATVAGTPSIYYGDEQGLRGVKEERAGGDDAVRPAYPATPDLLHTGGSAIYRLHQDLVGLRRRHPWLHRARTEIVDLTNEQLTYDVIGGDARLRVMLNLGEEPYPLTSGTQRILGGSAGAASDDRTVPPHGWVVAQ